MMNSRATGILVMGCLVVSCEGARECAVFPDASASDGGLGISDAAGSMCAAGGSQRSSLLDASAGTGGTGATSLSPGGAGGTVSDAGVPMTTDGATMLALDAGVMTSDSGMVATTPDAAIIVVDARPAQDLKSGLWTTDGGQLGCVPSIPSQDPCPSPTHCSLIHTGPDGMRKQGVCCACSDGQGHCMQVGDRCMDSGSGPAYCTAYHPTNINITENACLPRGCPAGASEDGFCYGDTGVGTCKSGTCVVTCKYTDPCTH